MQVVVCRKFGVEVWPAGMFELDFRIRHELVVKLTADVDYLP
jgi:hypothetical protein